MWAIKIFIFNLFSLFVTTIECAEILVVFPFPGASQYISVEPFLKALAKRGHRLTVISHFPQKEKLENFSDIVVEYDENYDALIKAYVTEDTSQQELLYKDLFRNGTLCVLENAKVQQLIKSKKKFDLLIVEAMYTEALYALGPHFNAHMIGFSTFGTDWYIDKMVGNTSPVSYIPPITSSYPNRMNFWQRLHSLVERCINWYHVTYEHFEEQKALYRKHFPHLNYTLEDIRKNFSLVLLNNHFSVSFPRPYVPNMIEVGGLYLEKEPNSLPWDVKRFLDEGEHGVIYFSLGSNVKTKDLPKEKLVAIFKVFASFRILYVLWKFEGPNIPEKPKNVFISKWLPQPEVLAHPNVIMFITHGSLLSTIEAIYYGKPVIGIPLFFDQFMNIENCKKMGFGLSLPYKDLDEWNLKDAIMEMYENMTYLTNAQAISRRYHDQPIKPLDNAIFWTEYVLRHNGAAHMRVAARDLTFIQFYSLDTIGFILLIMILALILFFVILKALCKLIFSWLKSKIKKENNDIEDFREEKSKKQKNDEEVKYKKDKSRKEKLKKKKSA